MEEILDFKCPQCGGGEMHLSKYDHSIHCAACSAKWKLARVGFKHDKRLKEVRDYWNKLRGGM
jgi:predicted RNA-binding Zn-ribbon protein involved in translation (DUF1610 family)